MQDDARREMTPSDYSASGGFPLSAGALGCISAFVSHPRVNMESSLCLPRSRPLEHALIAGARSATSEVGVPELAGGGS